MELAILIHLLLLVHNCLNVVSDSAYVVGLFSAIEIALISSFHSIMLPLLQKVQYLVKPPTHPLFTLHTHSHTNLSYFIIHIDC